LHPLALVLALMLKIGFVVLALMLKIGFVVLALVLAHAVAAVAGAAVLRRAVSSKGVERFRVKASSGFE
jgi:amino acid transporter